jgi:hypothetical protein
MHFCFKGEVIKYYFDTEHPSFVMVFDGVKWNKVPSQVLYFLLQTPILNTLKKLGINPKDLPVLYIKTLII